MRTPPALLLLSAAALSACQDKADDTGDSGVDACFPTSIDVSAASTTYVGDNSQAHVGDLVVGGEDMNADGVPDVVLAATTDPTTDEFAGKIVVASGAASGSVDLNSAQALIVGEAEYDYFGSALSVRDFDGDGYAEVMAGSKYSDAGAPDAGSAYLFYGPVSGSMIASSADLVLRSEVEQSYFGASIAGGGVVVEGGSADFVVGMPGYDLVVFYRGPLTAGEYTEKEGITDFLDGEHYKYYYAESFAQHPGDHVGLADLDADGLDDVIIGARDYGSAGIEFGRIYVSYDPYSGFPDEAIDLEDVDGSVSGTSEEDRLSTDLETPGDLNADGYGDLLLGVEYGVTATGSSGGSQEGKIAVVLGPLKSRRTIDSVDAVITGTTAGEKLGQQVDAGEDVNADGYLDYLLGASGAVEEGAGAGRAYLVYGPLSGTIPLDSPDLIIKGQGNTYVGTGVSMAGDVNKDGFGDLLVTAPGDPGGAGAGQAFLFTGCLR